jgi:hypothetical protein
VASHFDNDPESGFVAEVAGRRGFDRPGRLDFFELFNSRAERFRFFSVGQVHGRNDTV